MRKRIQYAPMPKQFDTRRLRTVSEQRARKLAKLGVTVWWRPGHGWTWDPRVDPRKCESVDRTGAHSFDWEDSSFDHEFGTQRIVGFTRCECGAHPSDHGMYDIEH